MVQSELRTVTAGTQPPLDHGRVMRHTTLARLDLPFYLLAAVLSPARACSFSKLLSQSAANTMSRWSWTQRQHAVPTPLPLTCG